MKKPVGMRSIPVDEEVLRALHERAEPWRDQPNDVLRKLLNLPPRTIGTAAKRPKQGEITSQESFRLPLLETLQEMGGKAPAPQVIERVGQKVTLKPLDYEKLNTGDIRWRNAIAWERAKLVEEGLMKFTRKRGVWEISGRGQAYLEAVKGAA